MSSYKETTLTQLEIPKSLLLSPINDAPQGIPPFILDDFALAMHLGVRCKTLWYCIINKKDVYKRFEIPKKGGKKRVIFNPNDRLKHLQRRLDTVILRTMPVMDCVGAYVEGRSCRDSAARHAGHKVRIAMDLKDFFPSHSRARVRRFFKDVVGYSHFVSGVIADLCTTQEFDGKRLRHFVPQGSPASPMLCNLIAQHYLDRPVLRALEGTGWVYTRYSDDLSLSHPEPQTREAVDKLIEQMRQLIVKAGYRTNAKKLKVQRHWHRQHMLGMVVNEHPNIPVDVYRRYRAILHNCVRDGFEVNAVRYGFDPPEGFISHLQGKISYFMQVNPAKAKLLKANLEEALEKHKQDPLVVTSSLGGSNSATTPPF